ncbi:MAG: DUF6970 domain-containing protein [Adhaeribacter sp.]
MKKATIHFLFLALFTSCQNDEIPQGLPACVKDKISQYKNNPNQNPPAQIWQYQYKGQTVYYVPPACCDQFGELYDQNCNLICYPDGGITGRGDGKCEDFFATRQHEKLIWEDKR